jgi:hypothetical protein
MFAGGMRLAFELVMGTRDHASEESTVSLVTGTESSTGAEGVAAACLPSRAGGGGSTPTSALRLRFGPIGLAKALELNRLWHSHLPVLDRHVAAWLCFAATDRQQCVAVAIWSLPVARMLPQDGTCLELRRFAIAPAAPRNTASRMLGWMAREIRRERPAVKRLLSYQDGSVHRGTIYRASGWTPCPTQRGGDWNHKGRRRQARRLERKVRWELMLGNRDSRP